MRAGPVTRHKISRYLVAFRLLSSVLSAVPGERRGEEKVRFVSTVRGEEMSWNEIDPPTIAAHEEKASISPATCRLLLLC